MKKLLWIVFGLLIFNISFGQSAKRFDQRVDFLKGFKAGSRTSTTAVVVDSIASDGTSYRVFNGVDTLNPYVPVASQIDIGDVAPLLVDTVPLITFGVGAGLTADTALFNNNVLAGCFYNEGSDTLYITQLMGILKEGTGTETISVQVAWHATMLSGSAVTLNSSALAITSLTTGTADVSFNHKTIPPNVFVWCILSGASSGNKPTFLNVTLSGYRKHTY